MELLRNNIFALIREHLQTGDRFMQFCVLPQTCLWVPGSYGVMMTSSNETIFRVTGHLCAEFTGHRWIPRTKASDAELWGFLWSKGLSKQWWGWWFETPSRPLWRHCNVRKICISSAGTYGYTHQFNHRVQSRRPRLAHQDNGQSWRLSRTNRRLSWEF